MVPKIELIVSPKDENDKNALTVQDREKERQNSDTTAMVDCQVQVHEQLFYSCSIEACSKDKESVRNDAIAIAWKNTLKYL